MTMIFPAGGTNDESPLRRPCRPRGGLQATLWSERLGAATPVAA